MSWFAALRDTARTGLTLDRALTDPKRAVRGAVAVALVLFPTLALGGVSLATSAAMGAFIAGSATFQRSFRPRASLAVAAGAGLGISTFLGYLAAGVPGLFPVLLAVWAFGAGLAWAIGPTAGVVATNTVSVMLIVVQLPVSVTAALGHGLVAALGGVVQAVVITLWPIGSWSAQRDALADTYAELADYARRLRQDPTAHVDPAPFMTARHAAALTPWQDRHRPPELRGLRGIAERIRPTLAALADPRIGAPEEGPERDRAREVLAAAAEVMDALARAVSTGDPLRFPRSAPALTLVRPDDEGPRLQGAARRSARRLGGLLRKAADTLDRNDEETITTPVVGVGGALHKPSIVRMLPVALRAVRRQLRPRSAIFQHAVRLAAVVTVSYLLARLAGFHHGYWAPMTAAMVMRPDFAQTYSRGVARLAGTVVGVAVSTLVVQLAHPGEWVLAALAVVCIGGAYLAFRTGYALTTVGISTYVVFLLGLQAGNPLVTAFERVGLTLLGGTVALVTYALFPTWQTARLGERLAEWLAAAGRYAGAVVACYVEPGAPRGRVVRSALLDSREARSELLQAMQRADAEPGRHESGLAGVSRRQIDRARAAVGALGRAAVLLEAHLPGGDAEPVPGAREYGEELRLATAVAAGALLTGRGVEFGAVRGAQARLEEGLAAAGGGAGAGVQGEVVRAGTRLVGLALRDLERALRGSSGGGSRDGGGVRGEGRGSGIRWESERYG
ncbi:putative membrane protein YccC [Streptomyces sp. 1114.5]|uniref:FUSC family protein n=1 Tax=Streptomyces sp. 1114.5 TaxID=1938830 RepID=UPI000EB13CD0|nr:FUSC family protein [Streptomyces sp. 1114.5]RKT16720.1 putative membrane protein YccC [Streptomyces sp. 1114.5]